MKILAISPWVPTTRRPRSRKLLEYLAETHDVHLVCAGWTKAEVDEAKDLPVPATVVKLSPLRGLIGATAYLLSGRSLQQGFVSSRRLYRAVRLAEQQLQPDAYYFNVIRSAHIVRQLRLSKRLMIIDLDELRSEYYALMSRLSKNIAWRSIAKIEQRRMARAEEHARKQFDRVLFSSPLDVARWPETSTLVRSPASVNVSREPAGYEPPADIPNGPYILFVGRLGYRANAEAIEWFSTQVWPKVRLAHPEMHLLIVGEAPGAAIRKLEDEFIHVTGRVPELEPYYERAKACIVPVTMATGVQLKLIEALNFGRLSIVTPVVAAGAGVENGQEVLVAEATAEAWAQAVEFAITDEISSSRIALNGHRWVQGQYCEQTIRNSLLRAFASDDIDGDK